MKRFFSLFAMAILAIGLIGCNNETETTELTAPETLEMADVDEIFIQ